MPTTAARRSLQLSAEWSFLRSFSTVRQPEITFPLASGNKLIKSRTGRNLSWEHCRSHLEAYKQAHVWVSGGRGIRVSDLFDKKKVGLLRRKVSVQMIGKLLDKIIEVASCPGPPVWPIINLHRESGEALGGQMSRVMATYRCWLTARRPCDLRSTPSSRPATKADTLPAIITPA